VCVGHGLSARVLFVFDDWVDARIKRIRVNHVEGDFIGFPFPNDFELGEFHLGGLVRVAVLRWAAVTPPLFGGVVIPQANVSIAAKREAKVELGFIFSGFAHD
jgi:hypothetical protein